MAGTPVGHMIFYIALFIIIMIALYLLIVTTLTQVVFWILRPSEMAAMDLVGVITALGGTNGRVMTDFKTYLVNMSYYAKKSEKLICVIAQRRQRPAPIAGVLTSVHCFSTPFVPQFDFDPYPPWGEQCYEFQLDKTFNPTLAPYIWVEKGANQC